MKQIKITFRLTSYQLARGLQTMKQLDPTYQLISLSGMVKTIYHDYISKMTINKTSAVPASFVHEIEAHINNITSEKLNLENLFSTKAAMNKKSLDEIDLVNEPESIDEDAYDPDEDAYDPDEELSEETLAEIEQIVNQAKKFESLRKASEFHDPNLTESDISTLTDFSPPKDWEE